jgi:hypothetical protein
MRAFFTVGVLAGLPFPTIPDVARDGRRHYPSLGIFSGQPSVAFRDKRPLWGIKYKFMSFVFI